MRDRDPLAPELLSAGREDRGSFGEVALDRGGNRGRFRFAVTPAALPVLQRILASRPFDAMPGVEYRYFYAGQSGSMTPVQHSLLIRVEQGTNAKTLEFDAPRDLVGVLAWFRGLEQLSEAEHLRAPI